MLSVKFHVAFDHTWIQWLSHGIWVNSGVFEKLNGRQTSFERCLLSIFPLWCSVPEEYLCVLYSEYLHGEDEA